MINRRLKPLLWIASFVLLTHAYSDRWLPLDEAGWTILSPTETTRVAYVDSAEGDDVSAKIQVAGDDVFLPRTVNQPFKTIEVALEQVRAGNADWVLLNRGGTWVENHLEIPSGESAEAPFILAAYGEGGRPLIKGGIGKGIILPPCTTNVVLRDFYLLAHQRVWGSPDYVPDYNDHQHGISLYSEEGGCQENVLIENCRIEKFKFNCFLVVDRTAPMCNFVLRRNSILDSYTTFEHSSGILCVGGSLLLEENNFDHNGWRILRRLGEMMHDVSEGQGSYFNHNTYFADARGVTFRNNVFIRPSSMQNKWSANQGKHSARDILLENNFYYGSEIATSAGGNTPGPLRFKNVVIKDNVWVNMAIGGTQRRLGWGIEIKDWDGGKVTGNMLINQPNPKQTSVYAINLGGKPGVSHSRNIEISGNIFHGLKTKLPLVLVRGGQRLENIVITENIFQGTAEDSMLLLNGYHGTELEFKDNVWFVPGAGENALCQTADSTDIKAFVYKSTDVLPDLNDLNPKPLESGPVLAKEAPVFPDAERTLETYLETLGETPTIEGFAELIRNQCKANWRTDLKSPVINTYLREGFYAP